MNFDYAVHSDFLIHWTGKDIDYEFDQEWYESDKSKTNKQSNRMYIKRLHDILKYGLWMTEEIEVPLSFEGKQVPIPIVPKTCFSELKVSESRKHAKRYGRLGIGVKRPFVFEKYGRPLSYYGFHPEMKNDKFLEACSMDLNEKQLLNFFKPMNSTKTLNYDYYGESEWRIIYFKELLSEKIIIDPRDNRNIREYKYFCSLTESEQEKLKYLIPLNGWFAMIIYPSLVVKNEAQQNSSNSIQKEIERIKTIPDHGNRVEGGNLPIEVNLDACRNF